MYLKFQIPFLSLGKGFLFIEINSNTTKQFYIKDHLGITRAVTNSSNEVISAADYDAWGYKLREWDSQNTKYKFTGKERDIETNYDYFGARYYDARIGRWGGTDPLFEKHINFTPYNYVLNRSLNLIDPDGMDGKNKAYMEAALPMEGGTGNTGSLSSVNFGSSTGMEIVKWATNIVTTFQIFSSIEETRQSYLEGQTKTVEDVGVRNLEMSNKHGKLEGVETQLKRVEEHLNKLRGIGPNDPNPDGKRKEWISHTTKALREGAKDFKSAFRKVSGKDYLEYLYKTFGKERINEIAKGLKENGIDFRDFVK
ncbi:MAG: hypothetical protein J0M18_00555 [Ignavibacteria bacterium]|nr:hypothetical protein [Ignavibacteria bacterium]